MIESVRGICVCGHVVGVHCPDRTCSACGCKDYHQKATPEDFTRLVAAGDRYLAALPRDPGVVDSTVGKGRLPKDAVERKAAPVATGVLDYFPDALVEVARVSKAGNEQHHPGAPLHWDKSKSTDEADALVRHLLERGTRDSDGQRHSAKVAWRALALLQRELDAERKEK